MSADEISESVGLAPLSADGPCTSMQQLTVQVLEDVLYNIVHDICLRTHREEKIARANSAAIAVEKKAELLRQNSPDEDSDTGEARTVKTDMAAYINGESILLKNPLTAVNEILCPKCSLTRLLYPIDGKGARKPDHPLDHYCKARPFIDKLDHDIYGQTFKPEGPGRGKRKADMVETKVQTEDPKTTPPPDAPRQNIAFPHAKCQNCNSHIPIRRMNRHMMRCIGGGGRGAAKNANQALQNGNGNGSRGGSQATSRNGTPAPGSQTNGRGSPNKRSMEDGWDSESPVKKKKASTKKTAAAKLKAPSMKKSSSQHSASKLSFESRLPNSDDDDGPGNDDNGDGEYDSTIAVEPKKKTLPKIKLTTKKKVDALGLGIAVSGGMKLKEKKWKYGTGNKPAVPPDVIKIKKTEKSEAGRASPDSSRTMSSSPPE
ncbi:hypothetical protein BJ878DRAFT_286129 [Calycina marina]|uniref:SAGA-associated factor 11 n=1 Tax=Calycina marina TaxID=1763456 RepID=A0A9P7YVJ8_9HELO|nr:hypothetical protein BJ878DRAFT_286129 [Calycina marina]